MTVAGSVAAVRVLRRRHDWEQQQRAIALCVDLDDATDAAIRAALPFDQMLQRLAASGATHVSLPELTLDRLLQQGVLAPQAPPVPLSEPAPLGHWNYLYGPSPLVRRLTHEMCHRLPYTEARVIEDNTLAFAGNLPAVRNIGLGFDDDLAVRMAAFGLGVVPRPVSYEWPDPALLQRTLAQAAQHGRLVAFAGDMVLGHEMHLDQTVAAIEDNDLAFVYFAHSRHQKGDWFVAKRRTPHVVLGHRFSPDEMIPLDYHAAAHNWVHLAREHGIRFCYINFFRVLHATEPLEGLHYVQHVREALEKAGYEVSGGMAENQSLPQAAAAELALAALAPAGIAAAATARTLSLPQAAAVPVTLLAAAGASTLPVLEQIVLRRSTRTLDDAHSGHEYRHRKNHDHHHEHHHHDHHHGHDPQLQALYPPSYAPKLLALATTTLAPLLAVSSDEDGMDALLQHFYPLAAASSLAALTSDLQYILRIEQYRGFGLDWLTPLAGAALQMDDGRVRLISLATLSAAWFVARRAGAADLLAAFDAPHALGHTHHVSGATRLLGDLGIWFGPRPARKWAALLPLALAVRRLTRRRGLEDLATAATFAAAASYALALSAFRQPQRHLTVTTCAAAPAFALSAGLAVLLEGPGP